jgi:DNA-directed RNA polymerase subunit K/omega
MSDDEDYVVPIADYVEDPDDYADNEPVSNPDNASESNTVRKITGEDRLILPIMTTYEYCRMVETRSKQIDNASSTVMEGVSDSLDIAEKELAEGKCPLFVGKPLENGSRAEKWHTSELTILDNGLQKLEDSPIQSISGLSIEEMINFGSHTPKLRKFVKERSEHLKKTNCKPENILPKGKHS